MTKREKLLALKEAVERRQDEIEEFFQQARELVGEDEPAHYTCDFLLNNFLDVDKFLEKFQVDTN